MDRGNILVSLNERHANNIFAGTKRVELRRRIMNVRAGGLMWIYVKLPIGKIVGRAQIMTVDIASPETLWNKHRYVSGLTYSEFFEYFAGVDQAVALVLEDCQKLTQAITLNELRASLGSFHPPQFFAHLLDGHPLLAAVHRAA